MNNIEDFIKNNKKIPTLPSIAVEILNAVRSEDSSFESLASVVNSDPSLAARVLKIANSSFYGLQQTVNTIPKALSILGLNTLKTIALSFVTVESMRGTGDSKFDYELFWKRAISTAVAAELISKATAQRYEEAFVSGLLQDIGVVIMYLVASDDYQRVLDEKRVIGRTVSAVEHDIFGFDHQEVGGRVLQNWKLPESIVDPIRYHHSNGSVPEEYANQAKVLQLSDRISAVYHGTHSVQYVRNITTVLKETYGVSKESAEDLIDAVAGKSIEVFSLFEIRDGIIKPYSQLLQEANEELEKLNLTHGQMAFQYKQEKQKADDLARELKDVNEKLRDLVFMDPLTGLYNRRFFFTTLENELKRARRYSRPFSLILFDVDHFKSVNDRYGHLFGDIVLQSIADVVEQVVRNTDVVARYGGEEFGIVLPETDLQSAIVMGERLRRQIEECEIMRGKEKISVTISLGIADYSPRMDLSSIEEILDNADQALYEAKKSGRNRISVLRMSA